LAVKQEILNSDLDKLKPKTSKILRTFETAAIDREMEQLRQL